MLHNSMVIGVTLCVMSEARQRNTDIVSTTCTRCYWNGFYTDEYATRGRGRDMDIFGEGRREEDVEG